MRALSKKGRKCENMTLLEALIKGLLSYSIRFLGLNGPQGTR
jgi:hypothetical protein